MTMTHQDANGSLTDTTAEAATPTPRKAWAVMVVLGVAEMMATLDTPSSTSPPSAQSDLGFADSQRTSVVSSYALAFGRLLLLGGRVSDMIGRRRAFLIGALGFATASTLGGLAPGFATLVTARTLQGAFAALLAPAALSILSSVFPTGRDRARAFSVVAELAVTGFAGHADSLVSREAPPCNPDAGSTSTLARTMLASVPPKADPLPAIASVAYAAHDECREPIGDRDVLHEAGLS